MGGFGFLPGCTGEEMGGPCGPSRGPSFGPLFSPWPGSLPGQTGYPEDPWNWPDRSGTFGPIFTPPPDPPTTTDTFGGDMGGFLPGLITNRDSLLGRIIQTAGAFLPQATGTDCSLPENRTKLECQFTGPQTGVVVSPGGNAVTAVVRRAVSACQYPTKTGKMRGGRMVIQNGQIVCVPKARRMSPCNPHAARRAVRRLSMVHSFMRSIEKSMNKACRAPARRSSRGGKCVSCKKVNCSC